MVAEKMRMYKNNNYTIIYRRNYFATLRRALFWIIWRSRMFAGVELTYSLNSFPDHLRTAFHNLSLSERHWLT